MPERMLPALVAAMAFLAALAIAGAIGTHLLARRWSSGAAALVTVQVPDPGAPSGGGLPRIEAVMARLGTTPGLEDVRRLDEAELRRLLRPWLGGGEMPSLPLPGVVEVRLGSGMHVPGLLARQLEDAAPGVIVEDSAPWSDRLLALATSLQACAGLALLTVTVVAGGVVALATRAGIATRRDAIEIVHGLGASDGYIAGRFARRAGWLALVGAVAGTLLALPLLGGLSHLAAPFAAGRVTTLADATLASAATAADSWAVLESLLPDMLPWPLLAALPVLPLAAGVIGWLTAQGTVRVWLRRLP
ncbi:cell division protein FtsX [Lichenicoccus sp.]|uniref:cell division protein FtsX n=1 Tax=Lichenicoccus sp. TaxID=2781899 RepID=UPI003D116590